MTTDQQIANFYKSKRPFGKRLREWWGDWWLLIVAPPILIALAILIINGSIALTRNTPPAITEEMAIARYIDMRDICLTHENVTREECERIALDWMLAYGDANWYKYR